jgi:hypothetical protein
VCLHDRNVLYDVAMEITIEPMGITGLGHKRTPVNEEYQVKRGARDGHCPVIHFRQRQICYYVRELYFRCRYRATSHLLDYILETCKKRTHVITTDMI